MKKRSIVLAATIWLFAACGGETGGPATTNQNSGDGVTSAGVDCEPLCAKARDCGDTTDQCLTTCKTVGEACRNCMVDASCGATKTACASACGRD